MGGNSNNKTEMSYKPVKLTTNKYINWLGSLHLALPQGPIEAAVTTHLVTAANHRLLQNCRFIFVLGGRHVGPALVELSQSTGLGLRGQKLGEAIRATQSDLGINASVNTRNAKSR